MDWIRRVLSGRYLLLISVSVTVYPFTANKNEDGVIGKSGRREREEDVSKMSTKIESKSISNELKNKETKDDSTDNEQK